MVWFWATVCSWTGALWFSAGIMTAFSASVKARSVVWLGRNTDDGKAAKLIGNNPVAQKPLCAISTVDDAFQAGVKC